MKSYRNFRLRLTLLMWVTAVLLSMYVLSYTIEAPAAFLDFSRRSAKNGPFTRGPKKCTESSLWSRGWGPDCTNAKYYAQVKRSSLPDRQRQLSIQRQQSFLKAILRYQPKARRLTALIDSAQNLLPVENHAFPSTRKRWGKWRTPGNSNSYSGMRRPVANDNPFGSNVLFRESDNDVNTSKIESAWYNPLFDSWKYGLPHIFYSNDISVPCGQSSVDCSPVKFSFPVSDIHTPYTAFEGFKSDANETTGIDSSQAKNVNNSTHDSSGSNTNQSGQFPSNSWRFEFNWPKVKIDSSWANATLSPSYPRDSFPWQDDETGRNLGVDFGDEQSSIQSPNQDSSTPPYNDDIFVPAQNIVARSPPHVALSKKDQVDRIWSQSFDSRTRLISSTSKGQPIKASFPDLRILSSGRSPTNKSSRLTKDGRQISELIKAKNGLYDLRGDVKRLHSDLEGWDSILAHDFSSIQRALREPPQKIIQSALDKWIEDTTRKN